MSGAIANIFIFFINITLYEKYKKKKSKNKSL